MMTVTVIKPAQDRKKVSDAYEVDYFAQKHAIARMDAIRILNLHRSDRDASDRAAHRLKR
ncbi:hypothetical protein [Rhizobium leguminosarum]|uniref:hypothetical protein n=1 Tax=Rhizobium leguminosarum TaxID=384 RepID=UPI001C9527FF|nr:hypothetical protein [Rhizobium leguminosarum]MBY5748912.1 hypothetical protein [Rhizobium leguminosarum]MBY5821056.1 hypothetical protein [Rhizobium leguminosarum]